METRSGNCAIVSINRRGLLSPRAREKQIPDPSRAKDVCQIASPMCNKAVVPPCAGRKRHARPKTAGAHFYKHSAVREALVRKIRLIDALPEGRYWQSLHQQARVAAGKLLHKSIGRRSA